MIRFCRAIGFNDFVSFKPQLAQQLGLGGVYTLFAGDDNDTVEDLRNTFFDTTAGSLLTVWDQLYPEVLKTARQAGAKVIGMAPQNTPLSEQCSLPVYVTMKEEHQAFAPVFLRISHLVIIDILATGVTSHRKTLLKDRLNNFTEEPAGSS